MRGDVVVSATVSITRPPGSLREPISVSECGYPHCECSSLRKLTRDDGVNIGMGLKSTLKPIIHSSWLSKREIFLSFLEGHG